MLRLGPRDIRCACALAFAALASGCGAPVELVELDDRQVLTVFHHQLGGPDWLISDNWVTDAPLDTWFGVEVDSEGNVTGLDLNGNRVIGEIPREIGMLESLKIPDLGNFVIMGGPEPWDENRLTGERAPRVQVQFTQFRSAAAIATVALDPSGSPFRNSRMILRASLLRLKKSLTTPKSRGKAIAVSCLPIASPRRYTVSGAETPRLARGPAMPSNRAPATWVQTFLAWVQQKR